VCFLLLLLLLLLQLELFLAKASLQLQLHLGHKQAFAESLTSISAECLGLFLFAAAGAVSCQGLAAAAAGPQASLC
jgi:hypothetical protein